jgi:hypothetical protein
MSKIQKGVSHLNARPVVISDSPKRTLGKERVRVARELSQLH